jgi:hypothetical protein
MQNSILLATGHKTESVYKSYSNHALDSDLYDVAATTEEFFYKLLPKDISGV